MTGMQTKPTHLIGRHLSADLPDLEPFDGPCAICGADGADLPGGWPLESVLTEKFADCAWLTGGRHVCEYCLRCLGKGMGKADAVRNHSCLATVGELRMLKRDDLWNVLMQPPREPFVLIVTFDHKKHMSFKSRVNSGGSPYWVTSDRDTCRIDLDAMAPQIETMQQWYTVTPDGPKDATWFTKDEILHGCTNFRRIERYGAARYRADTAVLEHLRGTHALEVLVYALSKRQEQAS